jgi:GNAT superfamily N-acetyltransferase
MNPLDNAVWYALDGPQARLAEGSGDARRFPATVAPFAAIPDAAGPAAWEALRALVGPGRSAVLFRAPFAPPGGWQPVTRIPCLQMVCARLPKTPPATAFETLGAADVDAMLDLVARTQPGPFGPRTAELGRYIGLRADRRLVAMAGERLRIAGATEVSAVCTDPEHRRRGLAAALVAALVTAIRERAETAFLHVVETNVEAIRVYDALGFETRTRIDVVALRAPA